MSSIIEGYNYDIFISYRQKDNKGDHWVSEFVEALKTELESTFKEEISVYFDINPHDGLLETHYVSESLKEKLKCLIFIPIISRTYCDPKSFAWEHEFKAFGEMASEDRYGLKVKLPNGNVSARVLPVQIHTLEKGDIKECELILNGVLRSIEFIYKEPGVNRPLKVSDARSDNLTRIDYRNQVNKVSLAIRELISAIKEDGIATSYDHYQIISDSSSSPPEKSIIVLPFDNISPDPGQEYFSDGLTEEIITDLSYLNDLTVISRSSAMTFKGSGKTIPEIAKIVNVRYVLEGSVRKAGNKLRITAQLIDGPSDAHLWAEKYNSDISDVFSIQEDISKKIVKSLKSRLGAKKKHDVGRDFIKDIKSYELFLKADYEICKSTKESVENAIRFLNEALKMMGGNPNIYSTLAWAYWMYNNIGLGSEVEHKTACEYAYKALELDPEFSKAHAILGWLEAAHGGNIRRGVKHFKKALAENPNELLAVRGMGVCYSCAIGRFEKATEMLNRLKIIDPLDFLINVIEGAIFFYQGLYRSALESWDKWYTREPSNPSARFYKATALIYCDRIEEGFKIIGESMVKDHPVLFDHLMLMMKYSLLGDKNKMVKELTPDIEKFCKSDPCWAQYVSSYFAKVNDKEAAMFWLETASDLGFIMYEFPNDHDPFYENLRVDERFRGFILRQKRKWENFKD
jgi:TolB-like protein